MYPISGVLGMNEVMGRGPRQYGSAFSRDPFASVVAIITLDITGEEKLVERCQILS